MWRLGVAAVLLGSNAHAEPVARFGVTFGVDRGSDVREFGPLVGVGLRAGGIVGELNYAYLSFVDPDSTLHRVGVSLRADLVRWRPRFCTPDRCTRSSAIYGELGAARRFGKWLVDDDEHRFESDPQSEVSFAFGYELGARYHPQQSGFQIGLRFSLARRDSLIGTACRGTGCTIAIPESTGLAGSVLLEYMFMIGR